MIDGIDEDLLELMEEVAASEDRDEVELDGDDGYHDPRRLEDAHIAETVAERALRGRFCWARGLDWQEFVRGCWREANDARVTDRVRRYLINLHAREARQGAEADRLRALSGLLSAHRIRAVVSLARGIVEVDAASFDQHPDLLNVGNGVVDLRTGTLTEHDSRLLLTKITPVHYRPGATSPDLEAALLALPATVVGYVQLRFGQAATGHATPDDVMPVFQGGGSNGKTTVVGAVTKALGAHAVTVPERVLMANPSDHPTELMTLRGSRFALIEETPEARHLSVKRLKDTVGTPTMTARLIGRDNVTWEATHSLFLTTNYIPRVDETDHGTWRRLALIVFPYTFVRPGETSTSPRALPGSPGLRERLREGRQGQHEAVLAWIVDGARQWYANDRVMPPVPATVANDTLKWRGEADLVCGYITENLVFDTCWHIATTDLYADFSQWIAARGHRVWADQTFSARFAGHGMVQAESIEKARVSRGGNQSKPGHDYRPSPPRYMAWTGVRFRTLNDPEDERGPAAD